MSPLITSQNKCFVYKYKTVSVIDSLIMWLPCGQLGFLTNVIYGYII